MTFDTTQLEYGTIGAICQKPTLIPLLASIVQPEDFLSQPCAELFGSAVRESDNRRQFDPVIAASLAADAGVSNPRQFIADCIAYCPSTANAELYAEEIRKSAEERRLREGIEDLLTAGGNDLAADLAALAGKALENRQHTGGRSLSDIARKAYDALFQPDTARIDTGYGGIDEFLKGVHGGELCVIGARPRVGTSAFALTLAAHAAEQGKRVLFFSLEMSGEELFNRLVVRRTKTVRLDEMIDHGAGKISEVQAAEIAAVSSQLVTLPLELFDRPCVTVPQIRAAALTQRDTALIVIDYLGLLTPNGKSAGQSRNLELGQISRDLKRLAMELNVPVVALSQLNREKESGDLPTLRDLRDSGEIEQNADKVIFLWRYDEDKRLTGVDIAKNRQGKTGTTLLHFDGEHMRFSSTTERYQPKQKQQRGFLADR